MGSLCFIAPGQNDVPRLILGRTPSGVLAAIDNQIDQETGTIKLKASFDNKDGALFPNQFVNVHLLLNPQ